MDNKKQGTPKVGSAPFKSAWSNSRPLARMPEVLPSPAGNANNTAMTKDKSRRGHLKNRRGG
jgi:hypothetical protein